MAWSPDPGAMNFTNVVVGFMNIRSMHIPLSNMCQNREDYFKNVVFFPLILLMRPRGGMVINFKIYILIIQEILKNGNNWYSSFQKVKNVKLLTLDDDARRRKTVTIKSTSCCFLYKKRTAIRTWTMYIVSTCKP